MNLRVLWSPRPSAAALGLALARAAVGVTALAGCTSAPVTVMPVASLGAAASQAVTGTPTRPQLSDAAAEIYTPERVLALAGRADAVLVDRWNPLAEETAADWQAAPHYRVDARTAPGATTFATVQSAVNHAHREALAGRAPAPRVVIGIAPGHYRELVYLPAGEVPITLRGLGPEPGSVRIQQTIDARLPVADYGARYAPVYEAPVMHPDIAAFYRACAHPAANAPIIGTTCSSVVTTRRAGTRLERLTIDNSHDLAGTGQPRPAEGQHQAVALKSDGADRLHLREVQLLGHQDTLYLAAPAGHIARSFVHRSLVAGDVDFIFGAGTAYFLDSEIRFVGGLRGLGAGYVAAPSTGLQVPHGFVFDGCDFTQQGGGRIAADGAVYLARQWFTGARCSPYGNQAAACRPQRPGEPDPVNSERQLSRATLEAVGKMVVLRSTLGPHLRRPDPWAPWQFDRGSRAYRPVQYDSDDFHRLLQAAGHDTAVLGYARPARPEPFLAEHRNRGGSAQPSER